LDVGPKSFGRFHRHKKIILGFRQSEMVRPAGVEPTTF